MRTAAALMSWTRPDYMAQALTSYAHAGVDMVEFVLLQDGCVTEEEQVRADQCLALFSAFPAPFKHIHRWQKNIGVTANQLRTYSVIFDEMGFEAMFHLMDDLVVAPEFFATGLLLQARVAAQLGTCVTQQYSDLSSGWTREAHATFYEKADPAIRASVMRAPHYLGTLTTRQAWYCMRETVNAFVQTFLEPIAHLQYPERGLGDPELQLRCRQWNGIGGGADATLQYAHMKAGMFRAFPIASRMRHIGEWGVYCNPGVYQAVGFGAIQAYDFGLTDVARTYTQGRIEVLP